MHTLYAAFLHLHLIYILWLMYSNCLFFRSHRYRLGHPGVLEELGEGTRLAAEADVECLSEMTRSLARRRSLRILSQRHPQAERMTLVPVLRAEVMPRRIPRTAALIRMVVLVGVAQRLLSRRG